MTMECYLSNCKYHGVHEDPDNGPFCHEKECRMTPHGIELLMLERKAKEDDKSKSKT